MVYSGARGTLIYEKNLKAKISCQTPFNSFGLRFIFLQTHATSHSFWKGGKPDRKLYPLPYGLRNSYRNLKSENSQDYAQKLPWNCTFINSASVVEVPAAFYALRQANHFYGAQESIPRNHSDSLCSLAGQYDSLIPIRFLAPMDCWKISALVSHVESRWICDNTPSIQL